MRPETQRKTAFRLALVAAVVALACTVWLVADFAWTTRREAADERRFDELTERTRTDPGIAETLHLERERTTTASLDHEDRARFLAWTLLVAASVFVAGGKWFTSLRPQSAPPLDELVAVRFAAAPPLALRPSPAGVAADEDDRSFVDALVERFGRSREAAIPILQAIQAHYRYLPDAELRRVCERTEITPAQIAGTSGFYAQFRRSPVGRHVVRVCHGTACHVAGAERITGELRRHLDIAPGEDTDPRRRFTIERVACVGCCSLAPVMMIEDETAGRLTPAEARRILDSLEPPS
jgi:NADH:ubiquinone oxidoreductase subunit E